MSNLTQAGDHSPLDIRETLKLPPSPESMQHGKRYYRSLFRDLFVIAALFSLNSFGAPGNIAFYVLLLWLIFSKGPEWTIKAVSLSLLVLVSNSVFADKTAVLAIMKFVIIFAAFLKLLFTVSPSFAAFVSRRSHYRMFTAYIVICVFLSIINNYFVIISLLKLVSFFAGASVVLVGMEVVKQRGMDLSSWFLAIVCFSVALGVAAYLIGAGYNAKTELEYSTRLFNGPFYHPQTLGPAAALMATYVTALLLYVQDQKRLLLVALLIVLLAFIYMSSSRTGMIAFLTGSSVLLALGLKTRRWGRIAVRWHVSKTSLLLLGLAVLLIVGITEGLTGRISENMKEFVTKGQTDSLELEELAASRESQFIVAMYNFKRKPITGIGFGTSTDPRFGKSGLLSAPTEKGFLPLAALEETGLIGTAFFTFFLISFFRYLWRQGNIVGAALFAGLLGANIGEMMFFSFGGQGGFMWMFVCAGAILGSNSVANPLAQTADPVSDQTTPLRKTAR